MSKWYGRGKVSEMTPSDLLKFRIATSTFYGACFGVITYGLTMHLINAVVTALILFLLCFFYGHKLLMHLEKKVEK
ncbi:MAG: hypothetical protein ABSB18_03990 [Candidatus Omnitrophota bacterium]